MKILIIQQKMIGDVLTSSILFEALRKKYPEAELHYLIYPHTKPVVENNPFIDRIITYNPEEDGKPQNFLNFLKLIRKENYEVVIDVYSKIATGIISKASRAPVRISYHKWYTAHFYTKTEKQLHKPQTDAGLAVENRMLLLKALGKDFPAELKPKIYLTEEEKTDAEKQLTNAGIDPENSLFMIGVLGSSKDKTYPPEFMAILLDEIAKITQADFLFNYIPKQKEEVEEIYNLCAPNTKKRIHLDVFGKSLREFLALTAHCNALIGNEGGAINMAKAMDIPSFSIFSPQIKKENWSIYEDGIRNVSVHLNDFSTALHGLSQKEITKNNGRYYELLEPNLIFASLDKFLKITSTKKVGTK
ncbi:glycosyltransferase family 9 protein [Salegentibacter flavus]|nr:glycosyltransferase family 9 protein [Salegentibacter flavus]